MDEILYGGGQSVPVRAGDQPDEANVVSDMFFIAPGTVLAGEYEVIASRPIRLGGEDEEPEVYCLLTFKGKVNNEKQLGAFTAIMRPEGVLALIKDLRGIYQTIPIELR